MKKIEEALFTEEIYEAAQAYRLAPLHNLHLVKDRYEALVITIARHAWKLKEEEVPAYRPEIGVVGRVFSYYKERTGKSPLYTLTSKRQKKGLCRLRECLRKTGGNLTNAEQMMKIAVDTICESSWHMGDNPQKKEYNDWEEQLFGSEERMEKWLEEAQR